MSEEEIIKILSDEIIALNVGHEKYDEAVQGLLDLYNKEKEEKEGWIKAYIRTNNYYDNFRNKINKIANDNKDCSDNEVIKAVKELKEKNAELENILAKRQWVKVKENGEVEPLFYISKDKIRELYNFYKSTGYYELEKVLEELLEE